LLSCGIWAFAGSLLFAPEWKKWLQRGSWAFFTCLSGAKELCLHNPKKIDSFFKMIIFVFLYL
jgi:hypothetical protein